MLRLSVRFASAVLATLLCAQPVFAQYGVTASASSFDHAAIGEALDVGAFSIQSIQLPEQLEAGVTVDVVLDGENHTLALYPWSIRSADYFEVLVQGADGEYTHFDPGPSQLWHGVVLGVPGSRVSANLSNGQLDALVRLNDGPLWGIQPLNSVDPSADSRDHVVFSTDNQIDRGYTCGGALLANGGPATPPSAPGYKGLANDKVAQVGIDTDVEYYNSNGSSVANTQADIQDIIDRVQNIYQADVSILYEITTIIVRTAEPDPYTSTNPSTLLGQFQNEWNSNQNGVVRDVAHMFTGKNINGGVIGIGFLNVICNLGSAYALSQSKFTSNKAFRAGLTAHEMGHNWSAPHCDGAGDCWIMCSGIGGCAGSVTKFGSGSKNSINNKKNSVGCLSNAVPPPPPVISSLNPSSVSPLGGQIQVLGTGLTDATSATVGGQTIGVILINDTSLLLDIPSANTLGPVSLTVSNDGGTSNALTLNYVVANPPVFQAPAIINTAFDTTATWNFATTPGDTSLMLVSLTPGTFVFKGFNVLNTPLPVLVLSTNAAGVGQLVAPIDPSLGGQGLFSIYTQMVFLNPTIYFTTNVATTLAF